MHKTTIFALLLAVLALFSTACDNDNGGTNNDFDRKQMLADYVATIVQPRFDGLYLAAEQLAMASQTFEQDASMDNLAQVKTKFQAVNAAFQRANAFNFGPMAENGLQKSMVEELGTFPCNTTKIEAEISDGVFSSDNFDRDARGLAAMDYLLYGTAQPSLIDAASRRAYFVFVVEHFSAYLSNKRTALDAYLAEFPNNNGTDAGSSTSLLYNEFVRNFEAVKNFKVGLPAGKRPGQTGPAPELSEGFYGGSTLDLLRSNLVAIKGIYSGETGKLSFDDYLQTVVGGPELVMATTAQWDKVWTALNNVPTDQPFKELLAQQHPSIDSLHTELQRHTRFFKSEMSSVLGIAITYASGDGD
jgi:uncharacterized protein